MEHIASSLAPEPLNEVAARVRRHPEWVLSLAVAGMVRQFALRWQQAENLLDVTDEVPVTAWIVRRKSDLLLPRNEEPENDNETALPQTETSWLGPLISHLQELQTAANKRHRRRTTFRPQKRVSVKGATLWKLAWSWPRIKEVVVQPPQIIRAQTDPIGERLFRVRKQLASDPRWFSLNELTQSSARRDLVLTILAITQLWHAEEVDLDQRHPYGPVRIVGKMPQ
ncbi:MAG: hypothetical protein ACYCOU_06620 [Sulfobacillus sp.]